MSAKKRDLILKEDLSALNKLEEVLGYIFKDKALLLQALTHSSFGGINHSSNYERLEFLGDAVLELLSSELLYKADELATEGELSKRRAASVNTESLACLARKLQLSAFMRCGESEERMNLRSNESVLADLFEAVVGAIYLDGGIDEASSFYHSVVIHTDELEYMGDPKSELQELIQSTQKTTPTYEVIERSGPDHSPSFKSRVVAGEKVLGEGEGPSKRASERQAALEALKALS